MDRPAQAVPVHTTPEVGITGQHLVIKGVSRIEAIVIQREELRREAALYTHVFSRSMRRDFNLTSVKLFWYAKSRSRRLKIRPLLADMAAEAQLLEDMARSYEMPLDLPAAATCVMRIISDEAEIVFDALVQADRAFHKLLYSPLAEVAEDNIGPFIRSFEAVRREVFGYYRQQLPGSRSETGAME